VREEQRKEGGGCDVPFVKVLSTARVRNSRYSIRAERKIPVII